MSFVHLEYFIPIVGAIFLWSFFYIKLQNNFFLWIKDHWFYKRSIFAKISTWCYLLGLSLLLLALMDLRGPEKRIKGNKIEQKTIILVDSSASMLAEDVRPNRFSKALLLVKHFVKKAVGQKISLVVFSDSQKRIVPFTEDIDLINARIDRLETLELRRGGTGLAQAIQESVQYFLNSSDEVIGNILIFTDAEETEFGFDINIPDSISVGLVGVGTRKGAPIPIRNSQGVSIGSKKHQGELVISKLDEKYIKSLGDKIKNFKYWIATSYSLPTEEIVSFFNRMSEVKQSEQEFRVRPIYSNYLIVPGVVLMIISIILKYTRVLLPFALFLFISNPIFAQEEEEEKEPVKSEKTLELEEEMAKGELPLEGQLALSYNLLNDGFPKLSHQLFKETLPENIHPETITGQVDLAVAEILSEKSKTGLKRFRDILRYLDLLEQNEKVLEFKSIVTKNVLVALQQQAGNQGKSQDQKNKDKGDQDDNQDNNQENGDQDQKENKSAQNSNDNQQNKNQSQGQQDQQKKSENKDKQKKIAKKKVPAILKQLLSDDNKLQKKIIDAETTERKGRDQKDW